MNIGLAVNVTKPLNTDLVSEVAKEVSIIIEVGRHLTVFVKHALFGLRYFMTVSENPMIGNCLGAQTLALGRRAVVDRDLLLLSGVSFMQRRKAESRSPLPSQRLNIVSFAVCYRVHVRGAHKIDSHVQSLVFNRFKISSETWLIKGIV